MERAKALPELRGVKLCKSAVECLKGADALAIVTEWPEFKTLDLAKACKAMRNPLMLDGRNLFDPKAARDAGFDYCGVGRP
jgi:UDPglucose 6-dehydrogenase